jgi:uncharacterized protein YfdQ (DUF2303 family)
METHAMTEAKTDFQAALDAGRALGLVHRATDIDRPFVTVPADYKALDLECWLPAPTRRRGHPTFIQEGGFILYVNEHKDAGTRLYAELDPPKIVAVIDGHLPNKIDTEPTAPASAAPRWGQHRATFAPPLDPDWLTWRKHDDKPMAQTDFAQFIEDNLPCIVKPDGAELLEVAQHLEASTNVAFKSAQRLTDGRRQFRYEETANGKVGNGTLEVPETFTLSLRVFRAGVKISLTARLRYRVVGGALTLWYHLDRPQDALDDAFQRLMDGVAVGTNLPMWLGVPTAS